MVKTKSREIKKYIYELVDIYRNSIRLFPHSEWRDDMVWNTYTRQIELCSRSIHIDLFDKKFGGVFHLENSRKQW